MIEKLLKFGMDEGYFIIKEIKDIEKSCCDISSTKVIDFDETKKRLIQVINQSPEVFQEPKSCDALKLFTNTNRLDFLEFKGLDRFISNLEGQSPDKATKLIDKQIIKFDFETKIQDSLFLLELMLKMSRLEITKAERDNFRSIPKNYIIMVDIEIEEDPVKNMALSLAYLSSTSNYQEKVVLHLIDEVSSLHNRIEINKPIIKSSKEIDNYYKELEQIGV
ncbi:hypothetical protein D3H55_23410 [Bacillus salacetis]|uniref:Uncharacterized protein n=1 Tax=Bacillus salacetis TaxID=2315464 RepID=A0A3A1QMW5_9BACI|nr:hypothetical protein [Bacillus salacetis]RIW26966.1 hypothetical protein D3H55_23410 [Bacillus salacetis]